MLTIIAAHRLNEALSHHALWFADVQQKTASFGAAQLKILESRIEAASLKGANFANAILVRCEIVNATFTECDFSAAMMTENRFHNCRFLRCRFVKAEMQETQSGAADFSGSDFTRANLSDADLRGANLSACRFDWAWLIGTDLRDACLENANFEGARIADALLYNQKQFMLGSLTRSIIENIDASPLGNGPKLSGPEALDFLRSKVGV